MTNGQDPTVCINEVYNLRYELVGKGEVVNDDKLLDIALQRPTDEYMHIKYSAETDNYFTLNRAMVTMRNMYANRAMRNEPSSCEGA